MADKLVYEFDINTRVLVGPTYIQESPMEPGVWLWPPNVTEVVPPEPLVGMDRVFVGDNWMYTEASEAPPDPNHQEQDPRDFMIVSRFQALAAMYNAGLLSAAEAYFSNGSTSAVEKLAWKNAASFYRLSPLVTATGVALGLTDEQLDDLFTAASLVTV